MKLFNKFFHPSLPCILSIAICCIFQGCGTKMERIQRPTTESNKQQSNFNLVLEANYRDQKYPIVIKNAEDFLSKNSEAWDVRLLLGLAYFNFGDIEKATLVFSQIPKEVRSEMVDSCLELQAAKTVDNVTNLMKIAETYFPDCLDDLRTEGSTMVKTELSDSLIRKYGRLYDEIISRNDEPEIRKLKELDFMKRYNFDERDLNEITSRYLEILADDSTISD